MHGCGLYILILSVDHDHLAHLGSCEVRGAWCAEDAVARWWVGLVWYGMVEDTRDATRPPPRAQRSALMAESTLRRGVGDGADPSAQRVALRCRS